MGWKDQVLPPPPPVASSPPLPPRPSSRNSRASYERPPDSSSPSQRPSRAVGFARKAGSAPNLPQKRQSDAEDRRTVSKSWAVSSQAYASDARMEQRRSAEGRGRDGGSALPPAPPPPRSARNDSSDYRDESKADEERGHRRANHRKPSDRPQKMRRQDEKTKIDERVAEFLALATQSTTGQSSRDSSPDHRSPTTSLPPMPPPAPSASSSKGVSRAESRRQSTGRFESTPPFPPAPPPSISSHDGREEIDDEASNRPWKTARRKPRLPITHHSPPMPPPLAPPPMPPAAPLLPLPPPVPPLMLPPPAPPALPPPPAPPSNNSSWTHEDNRRQDRWQDRRRDGFRRDWLWKPAREQGGMRRKEFRVSEWFCNLCNRDCKSREGYDEHVSGFHVPCGEPGCNFSGPEIVMAAHRLKHVKAADGSSVVDSPEELRAWIAGRRRNFPCPATQRRKAEEEEKRQRSGALEESAPQSSMLEKLLRKANDMEYRKGKGKFGKSKGKGKFDGSKGKEKGKNKGKGKGKGKAKRFQGGSGESASLQQDTAPCEHVTASLPLPSVLANCVPLEAPFGQPQTPSFPKRGICKYFSQGFCYHGSNCQFEHEAGPLALENGQAASTPHWWVSPSTLANRVCLIGEGPAAYHGVERRPRGARYEAPLPPEDRPRREGLLRRLLQADVDRYYSSILQCVRYIVATDFFRLEKAPIAQSSSLTLTGATELHDSSSPRIAKDLATASQAITGASGSFISVPRVELADDELFELAQVLEV